MLVAVGGRHVAQRLVNELDAERRSPITLALDAMSEIGWMISAVFRRLR